MIVAGWSIDWSTKFGGLIVLVRAKRMNRVGSDVAFRCLLSHSPIDVIIICIHQNSVINHQLNDSIWDYYFNKKIKKKPLCPFQYWILIWFSSLVDISQTQESRVRSYILILSDLSIIIPWLSRRFTSLLLPSSMVMVEVGLPILYSLLLLTPSSLFNAPSPGTTSMKQSPFSSFIFNLDLSIPFITRLELHNISCRNILHASAYDFNAVGSASLVSHVFLTSPYHHILFLNCYCQLEILEW